MAATDWQKAPKKASEATKPKRPDSTELSPNLSDPPSAVGAMTAKVAFVQNKLDLRIGSQVAALPVNRFKELKAM